LTSEGATTNGGHAIHSGRCWLERQLYDAPLPLVANNWPAVDDPSATFAIPDWSPHSSRFRADLQTAEGRAEPSVA